MMGRLTTKSSCFIHFALTRPFRRITHSARLLRSRLIVGAFRGRTLSAQNGSALDRSGADDPNACGSQYRSRIPARATNGPVAFYRTPLVNSGRSK